MTSETEFHDLLAWNLSHFITNSVAYCRILQTAENRLPIVVNTLYTVVMLSVVIPICDNRLLIHLHCPIFPVLAPVTRSEILGIVATGPGLQHYRLDVLHSNSIER